MSEKTGTGMRVVIDARMLSATGIGRYSANLLRELSLCAHDDDQYIVLVQGADIHQVAVGSTMRAHVVDIPWYSLAEQFRLPRVISELHPTLVHFPHFNVPLTYRGPFVVTIHDLTMHRYRSVRGSQLVYDLRQMAYRRVFSNAVARAQRILVPSEFTKLDLVDSLDVDPSKVVVTLEGGPDESSWSQLPMSIDARGDRLRKPFLLTVGTAFTHKNLETLVRALALLPDEYSVVVAGRKDSFHDELETFAQTQGLGERVIFAGFVPDDELATLYRTAEAYVFPSLNEGFGLPGLEAMGFGTPVIASRASCLPEILGDAALYFNGLSPAELAAAVLRLRSEEGLRQRMVDAGRAQVGKYSWSEMARLTRGVYEAVHEELAAPPGHRKGLGL